MGAVGVATYGNLGDGDMWGESRRVGCIRSRVWGLVERKWGSWGLDRCGCFRWWVGVGKFEGVGLMS